MHDEVEPRPKIRSVDEVDDSLIVIAIEGTPANHDILARPRQLGSKVNKAEEASSLSRKKLDDVRIIFYLGCEIGAQVRPAHSLCHEIRRASGTQFANMS
jgi:hypothetical protein